MNPKRINAGFHDDNENEINAECPVTCLCCWLTELMFKAVFKETINFIQPKIMNAEEVFKQLEGENQMSTSCMRWTSWFLSVIGHTLLFSPILYLFKWIPLVGGLLGAIASMAAFFFSLVWATTLHFFIMGISWIYYRPLYGILLLFGVVMLIIAMSKQDMVKYEVKEFEYLDHQIEGSI